MSSHIEYQRFRRGETCTEEGCRAKKFYIEDGKKFCQRGHEQFGFTQTQQDEDDWNAQGKKSRKRREEKEHVETILSGTEARELYLQCYQLILWKQCHWLVAVKGFPSELETVVRDLWNLRTRSLQAIQEGKSGYSSATGTRMMFSSQSEAETGHDTDVSGIRSTGSKRRRKNRISEEKLPRLVETLGLCYLGMLLLRLPTSLGELYKWVTRDELTYTRAITEVPKDMRSKLPAHFHSALEISSPLKQSSLHETIMQLVGFYSIQFEMVFPPLNTSLLLSKHVRDLGLPVEIIPAVRRLASLLNITFSYPLNDSRSHNVTIYPELEIISLIVIATKLSQPFDDIIRLPFSDFDATTVQVDWKKWKSVMAEQEVSGLRRGKELTIKDDDVWKMDGKAMDDYLDWYQRTWIDDRDTKMPVQILDLFPLTPIDLSAPIPDDTDIRAANLKAIHQSLIIQEPVPEMEQAGRTRINRPGELYRRYRKIEELPEMAKAFYEQAASNAGVSTKVLVKGVFLLEVQLENWMVKEKKVEAAKQLDLRSEGDRSEEDC